MTDPRLCAYFGSRDYTAAAGVNHSHSALDFGYLHAHHRLWSCTILILHQHFAISDLPSIISLLPNRHARRRLQPCAECNCSYSTCSYQIDMPAAGCDHVSFLFRIGVWLSPISQASCCSYQIDMPATGCNHARSVYCSYSACSYQIDMPAAGCDHVLFLLRIRVWLSLTTCDLQGIFYLYQIYKITDIVLCD